MPEGQHEQKLKIKTMPVRKRDVCRIRHVLPKGFVFHEGVSILLQELPVNKSPAGVLGGNSASKMLLGFFLMLGLAEVKEPGYLTNPDDISQSPRTCRHICTDLHTYPASLIFPKYSLTLRPSGLA